MQDTPDTTSSPVPYRRSPIPWIVIAHLALLAALFGSALNHSSNRYALFAFAAVLLAQASLVSIWLVLGWGASKAKLVILVCLPLLFLVFPAVVCPILVFVLPLVFTQSDGLRLTRFAPADLPPPRTLQFSMSQLMRLTIVVIVLFALGQFGPGQRELYAAKLAEFGSMLTVIGIVVVGLACVAMAVTIPVVCVWAVLSPGRILPRPWRRPGRLDVGSGLADPLRRRRLGAFGSLRGGGRTGHHHPAGNPVCTAAVRLPCGLASGTGRPAKFPGSFATTAFGRTMNETRPMKWEYPEPLHDRSARSSRQGTRCRPCRSPHNISGRRKCLAERTDGAGGMFGYRDFANNAPADLAESQRGSDGGESVRDCRLPAAGPLLLIVCLSWR